MLEPLLPELGNVPVWFFELVLSGSSVYLVPRHREQIVRCDNLTNRPAEGTVVETAPEWVLSMLVGGSPQKVLHGRE